MLLRTAEECRVAHVTYHLVPAPVWEDRGKDAEYVPEAFEADGFIHCTNGLDALLVVANLFCRDDARDYMVLVLDTTRIASEVRYDDDERVYPHIYGPLNTEAVSARLAAVREADGAFSAFLER